MKDWTISHNQRVGWFIWPLFVMIGLTGGAGCAGAPPTPTKIIYESGRNQVWLEKDPESTTNAHPANLSPEEIGTLLRGVRSWESRNFIHRLFSGEAEKTRAFRNEEITFLAPALSKALAQASPDDRVYFHLSHATEQGDEESTSGWLSIRQDTWCSPSARSMTVMGRNRISANMTDKCRTYRNGRRRLMSSLSRRST